MNYFDGITTHEDLQKRYRELQKRYHPDANPLADETDRRRLGDVSVDINRQYEQMRAQLEKKAEPKKPRTKRAAAPKEETKPQKRRKPFLDEAEQTVITETIVNAATVVMETTARAGVRKIGRKLSEVVTNYFKGRF